MVGLLPRSAQPAPTRRMVPDLFWGCGARHGADGEHQTGAGDGQAETQLLGTLRCHQHPQHPRCHHPAEGRLPEGGLAEGSCGSCLQ